MAYAKLALLPAEYGLYSSFVGVLAYWFFATSKDISIGPVAVMSTLVGNVITRIQLTNPEYAPQVIASALAVVAGAVVFVVGLLRLGFLVNYIPLPAIAAFMTGSALNIIAGQIPLLMGMKGFSTRESTYQVLVNTVRHIDGAGLDAVVGLSALALLYMIRWASTSWGVRRFPKWNRVLFFLGTMRTVLILLFYTVVSWVVNRNRRDDPGFGILGLVPKGLQHVGPPVLSLDLVAKLMPEIPATVIVLLIEHIVSPPLVNWYAAEQANMSTGYR